MARIEDLLTKIEDPALRAELEREVSALKQHVDFGLVFERHIPEIVDLVNVEPVVGDLVRMRRIESDKLYRVFELTRKTTILSPLDGGESVEAAPHDLLVVKPFGEPVYPSLTPLGSVVRNDERPFHAVINGENMHALQLLLYLYEGQVDCIYLDPPYNSGAADWKYNNRYVDAADRYRHSKWLSMMERRLKLAKRLLKQSGVLIVAIDENEVHHLGVLLEDLFRGYERTLITIVTNPKGTGATNFSRVEEYALFVFPEAAGEVIQQMRFSFGMPPALEKTRDHRVVDEETKKGTATFRKLALRRDGAESSNRADRPRQFYGILVDELSKTVVGVGCELALGAAFDGSRRGSVLPVYPLDPQGRHRVWRYGRETMRRLIEAGEIRVGRFNAQRDAYALYHWKPVEREATERRRPRSVWWNSSHDAGAHGSTLLNTMLGERSTFPFPKSLYLVRDCLELVVGNRPDALILDFFAGSGTTLHSTFLLNAVDGGWRRCLLVTNNEVDHKTTRALQRDQHYRGDAAFESRGIFELVTAPRARTAVTGLRPDGTAVPSDKLYTYLDGRPIADGFEENVEFYRLDYLDPDKIELGQAFEAIHPALWLIAGGKAPRPDDVDPTKPFYVAERAGYAILFHDASLRQLEQALDGRDDITHVFVVTDSEDAFVDARAVIGYGRVASMIYRDYLRTFRINTLRELS